MSQDGNIKRIKLISRGAYDDVFEVLWVGRDTNCAAKYIRLPVQPDGVDTADMLRQKVEKMQYLRQLDHANLGKVFDVQPLTVDSTIVLLMELVPGQSLKNHIRKRSLAPGGGFTEDQIRHYSKQICSALDHLHSLDHHIIHRNICSSTVLVTERNEVKLVDYGMSIQLLGETSVPRSEYAKNFPHYTAPELLLTDESCRYSRDSDIWAFGCLVYEMATGKRPYDNYRNINTVITQIRDYGAPDLPAETSETLRSFYSACVDPDRRNRASAIVLLSHAFLA